MIARAIKTDCPECQGSGNERGDHEQACLCCGGSRTIITEEPMIRICSYCCRACAGPEAISFGEAWTKDAQIEASKTAPITHTICLDCFGKNFGDDEIEAVAS